jgi:predicted phage terminase large subunit-like protein
MDTTEFDVLLRNDFSSFIARSFMHLDPQTTYAHNWHIDLLADRLTQVLDGKIRRLIITVPPRSLKSICASVAFPAWALGRKPGLRIVCASYSHDLSHKLARDTVAVMTSPWYQRAFATRLGPNRIAAADFTTTGRGSRLATSVGGVLTGLGGDIVIVDDPVKPDEAMSEVQRQNANLWFDNTLYSRLNDKRTGAIVIIMQRLHLDDLVGHVLEKEDWEVVNLPAIAAEEETWHYQTLFGPVEHTRAAGELLHPEREPAEVLQALRRTLGEYAFSAQYLQAPVPLGGGLVKSEWLAYYTPEEKPDRFDTIVQSWDTANKESELADYSVCTTWGVKGQMIYLLHVLRKRMEFPELKRTVIRQKEEWRAAVVLIEDKASGTQLIQELRQTMSQVKGVKCEGEKSMRMQAQTPTIENGRMLLPKEAPWLPDYVQDLVTFPKAKYDDQVDSTAQALKWITLDGREPSAITYMYMKLAESRGITLEEAREMIRQQRLRNAA